MTEYSPVGAECLAEVVSRSYSNLSNRIRTVEQSIDLGLSRTTLRIHYPALRDGKATVAELINLLCLHLTNYALPAKQINDLHEKYGSVSPDEYDRLRDAASKEAKETFKKAKILNNTNGEGGELLLYLLTEWILGAPQILAKMSLKTNPNMPVHGTDGIHLKYDEKTDKVIFYWGESKLYATLSGGISDAAESIKTSIEASPMDHELTLVKRHIDLSGLTNKGKEALLQCLDPMTEEYNKRIDTITCLVAFNFKYYQTLEADRPEEADDLICKEIEEAISKAAATISGHFFGKNIQNERIELFLVPMPSVSDFRDKFQSEVGIKS